MMAIMRKSVPNSEWQTREAKEVGGGGGDETKTNKQTNKQQQQKVLSSYVSPRPIAISHSLPFCDISTQVFLCKLPSWRVMTPANDLIHCFYFCYIWALEDEQIDFSIPFDFSCTGNDLRRFPHKAMKGSVHNHGKVWGKKNNIFCIT